MKKKFAWILVFLLCFGLLAGCAGGGEDAAAEPSAYPVTAAYATAQRQYDHVYTTPETEYVTYMDLFIHEDIKDVSFGLMRWDGESLQMEKVLFTAPSMAAGETFLAAVVFYGDVTTYGVDFTDAAGTSRSFSLMISGKDGSLEFLEY